MSIIDLLERCLDSINAPEPNCACHISPPCSDCIEHGELRELEAEIAVEINRRRQAQDDPAPASVEEMSEAYHLAVVDPISDDYEHTHLAGIRACARLALAHAERVARAAATHVESEATMHDIAGVPHFLPAQLARIERGVNHAMNQTQGGSGAPASDRSGGTADDMRETRDVASGEGGQSSTAMPEPPSPSVERAVSFAALRHANVTRQAEWPGNDKADVAFRALEVAGEAGECAEAVKKYLRAQRGIAGSTATVDDVADEIADTVISLDLLAGPLGIDLGAAVARKFNKTSVKYGMKTRLAAEADAREGG